MNGISSTLQDELKKTKDSKQKEKLKFVGTILLTNILVALICMPSFETKEEKEKAVLKTSHVNHQFILLPLTVLVSKESMELPETSVTLVSKENKVIVSRAYLHELVKTENEQSFYKVEINNSELKRVNEIITVGALAIPHIIEQKTAHKKSTYKGSKYEVNL